MDTPIRSKYGVTLLSLNWGYQIVHDNEVLSAIQDTQVGPVRSEDCSDRARRHYERLCAVYERLYTFGRKPSALQLQTLAHVIRGDPRSSTNATSVFSLVRRGVIRPDELFPLAWRT